ncbi:MAG: PspA/IM30 family protein [Actinomycetota bacterium]
MIRLLRRVWNYFVASGNSEFNKRADPAIQLEQAIQEAQTQHRQLKEQAANVIAHQKQTEIRLNRTMEEYEKVSSNARQAVMMADEANKKGDTEKVAQYTTAAEAFANRMIGIEREVEDLKALHLQASQAADQAKTAVNQNSSQLQKKLSERQKLLSQIDQAKMQEQLNKAMASLSEKVGEDVPSFEEIRDKVETRYAKAKGAAELNEQSIEGRMLEVEQASLNVEAQARLSELRAQLGLEEAAEEMPATGAAASEPAVAPGQTEAPPA